MGCEIHDRQVNELIQEARAHALPIYDESSAREWAGGYQFPPEYLRSDIACLKAAQRDFVSMVRRRLKILEPDRLNLVRIGLLRSDNPEITLLKDLAGGMRVPLPAGFSTNGATPRPHYGLRMCQWLRLSARC